MTTAKYDLIEDFYLNFVQIGLGNPDSLYAQTSRYLLNMMGDVRGKQVLDLCCGQGHLSQEMAQMGAFVTGIDTSEVNISAAESLNSDDLNLTFHLGDAQTLDAIDDNQFDFVVCKMALMDIRDLNMVFRSTRRVLKTGGRFLNAMLHPCFETPFTIPFKPIEQTESGDFKSHRVQRYFDEGLWHSGGDGVRGRVGAYHRTLSSIINGLLAAQIQLTRIEEPLFLVGDQGTLKHQWSQNIPRIFFAEGVAV